MFDFDLFIIGAGSGGVRAARTAANLGLNVCVAEEKYLGGTCVNVGCVPKKIFYYGSSLKKEFNISESYGWDIDNLSFNWTTLLKNKNIEISRLNKIYENILINSGVKILSGKAIFLDSNTVSVNGINYSCKNILIATGCNPTKPHFPGAEHSLTSDDLFYLQELPSSILIIGGGYIAVEFASIYNSLGVETTMSYRGSKIIKDFDHDLGKRLSDSFIKNDINLLFNSKIKKIKKIKYNKLEVSFEDGSIKSFDKILSAIGRSPATNNLSLSNTNVQLSKTGHIIVDENFRTTDENIFAIGDVIGTPQLTPIALKQAMIFVDNNFNKAKKIINYSLIPTAIFSQPNIASVGLTENEARFSYSKVNIYHSEFTHMKQSLSNDNEKTYMKLIVDSKSDKVIGAHMVGNEAGEIIQGLAVAINSGATKVDFDETLGIHPTAAEEFVTMRKKVD